MTKAERAAKKILFYAVTHLEAGVPSERLRVVTANILLETFGSCACKADEYEPTFTLRGQDSVAPMTVDWWAHQAKLDGASASKIKGARAIRNAMLEWKKTYGGKLPD